MKYLGCAYYPEYWGIERVPADIKLMKEAGIEVVRIGEFAWSRLEPEDGVYTLDWLHKTVVMFLENDMKVVLCTPTATPPAWLTSQYPDVCKISLEGKPFPHGRRRHYCSTSPTYRRYSEKITRVLVKEFSRYPNILAWQLDNEFGPELGWCFCENCQSEFQKWLIRRYGNLTELNRCWGTGFWSQDYSDWKQVRLAGDVWSAPSRSLDSKRFWSESIIEFALIQAEAIRITHHDALVTTNGPGPVLFPAVKHPQLFKKLDFASIDLYFDMGTIDSSIAGMSAFRNYKTGKSFWITETGSGALDHNRPPRADQFRAWAYSSIAHGADAFFIFRWRTCLSGQEQELQGMLEHSGFPGHRYKAVQNTFLEIQSKREIFESLPKIKTDVAIVWDYDSIWTYESSAVGGDVDYLKRIYEVHKALYDRNLIVDLISPDFDINTYRLVIIPNLVIIPKDFANRVVEFLEKGGVLLTIGQMGMRDQNANYLSIAGPDRLQEILGFKIVGGMYMGSHVEPDEALWTPGNHKRNCQIGMKGILGDRKINGIAEIWAGDISLADGKSLAIFSDDTYSGQPAIVENIVGQGKSIYIGAIKTDGITFNQLVDYALTSADIQFTTETPEYVEIVRRGNFTFYINHTSNPVTLLTEEPCTGIVGTIENGKVSLKGYDVCVVHH